MKHFISKRGHILVFTFSLVFSFLLLFVGNTSAQESLSVSEGGLGFRIPDISTILTFAVRMFFIVSGIAALFFGIYGAFTWITSSGEEEKLDAARKRIIAALVGVIMIIVVLAVMYTLEQFVFQQRICFGLSCPLTIPGLTDACAPNPQFNNPNADNVLAEIIRTLPTGTDMTPLGGDTLGGTENLAADRECCPMPQELGYTGDDEIRTTSGWVSQSARFGNYDYKICCVYGDFDGNQICDHVETQTITIDDNGTPTDTSDDTTEDIQRIIVK